MKKDKNKIIVGAVIVIALALMYWWGGNSPSLRGWTQQQTEKPTISESKTTNPTQAQEPSQEKEQTTKPKSDENATAQNRPQNENNTPMTSGGKAEFAEQSAINSQSNHNLGSVEYSLKSGMDIDTSTGEDKYKTEPVPDGKPIPKEPQNALISDKELTCTLSVRCDTILKNIAWLTPEKVDIVPKDGIIFPEKEVVFYEGESVFNLLLREMKKNKIHMEFENTPIYNSAYIEGIANIYEFDCGELSGWMYKVNGWFPNYGCSRYRLKAGDKVEWVYTCDWGADVGGYNFEKNAVE